MRAQRAWAGLVQQCSRHACGREWAACAKSDRSQYPPPGTLAATRPSADNTKKTAYFQSKEAAAVWYDREAVTLRGAAAQTNFPMSSARRARGKGYWAAAQDSRPRSAGRPGT